MRLETLALELVSASRARMDDVRHRPIYSIRSDIDAAFKAAFPKGWEAMEAALSAGKGKKAVVTAVMAAVLDLSDPEVINVLEGIKKSESWRVANGYIATLGVAGKMLVNPSAFGIRLPCSPCACPGGVGTNWGLPNVREVADRLASRSQVPTSGEGWKLIPA